MYDIRKDDSMAGIDSLEGTLYYQWLINNNSTSTMLNAISGADATEGIGGLGSVGSLGSIGSVGNVGSSFASILQSYLSGVDNTDSLTAASMADKLSAVLEEAAETEDTDSLSYRTVQEIYEYFSNQVSAKANALFGNTNIAGTEQSTENIASRQEASQDVLSQINAMNESLSGGEEFDFSKLDSVMDSVFAETMPLR